LALDRERTLLACMTEAQRRGFLLGLARLEESLGLASE
jgi:hypothetical protein